MIVINISGYNFGFKHKGVQYYIPFDNIPHPIPDDSPGFQELRVINSNVNLNLAQQNINSNIAKFQIYNNAELQINKLDPKALFIYHNLGLGDHIICNGFVRKLAESYNHVYLFCKPHNYESVNFMYRDLHKLEVLKANDNQVKEIMTLNKFQFKVCGVNGNWDWKWEDINSVPPINEPNMIHSFAKQLNLNVETRWDNFYFKRDQQRENILFKELDLKEKEYIFIHDDSSRNLNINIDSKFKIVRNLNFTTCIFDYCKILENAEEIHCMDSSFKILCEHLNTTNKLYYHQSVKNSNSWGCPISKKNWIVI